MEFAEYGGMDTFLFSVCDDGFKFFGPFIEMSARSIEFFEFMYGLCGG